MAYEYYDDDEERDRRPLLWTLGGLAAVAVLAGGFLLLRPASTDDIQSGSQASSPVTAEPSASVADDESAGSSTPLTVVDDANSDDTRPATTADSNSTQPDPANTDSATTVVEEPDAAEQDGTVDDPPVDSDPPAVVVNTTADPDPVTAAPSYPTNPDGTPQPIVAIYDTDSITLTGVVPSEEARINLEGLAIANSKFPDATMINLMTVDETVPVSVGVRVIELNSVRFPEGTADLTSEHQVELDRAVGIMTLFPNVSATVIGHADPRGDPQTNFVLSERRASAVTSYMVSQGIEPVRLSARAVGDADQLAVGETTDAAFALNRRTEFIFYGLLL